MNGEAYHIGTDEYTGVDIQDDQEPTVVTWIHHSFIHNFSGYFGNPRDPAIYIIVLGHKSFSC